MKQTEYFIPTLRESPADAVIPSHQLMVKSGLVRQVASGVFSFLPLGYKVLKKVIEILREEIDAIGGQEFLMPSLNPIDLWEQTGRVEAMGDVLFHIKNRDGLVLAPTHEEIIAFHASKHLKSYKNLPQIWYQIQTKFRNEPRPKSGVLRGRQFIMKDSYSLDKDFEGLDLSYLKHYEAYKKTFDRCGIKYFIVGASSGAMGGRQSQEFMVESNSGEDVCAVCYDCGYAANLEVAESKIDPVARLDENPEPEEFATPNERTIDELVASFGMPLERCAKSIVYVVKGEPILIMMRGNDQLNESKLSGILGATEFRPAESEEMIKFTGADHGSIGPINLKTKMRIIADRLLENANGLYSGANKDGFHFKNIDFARDAEIEGYHDLREIETGEPCPKCGEELKIVKAIELGHIFKLGTKYSEALGANFLDSEGCESPIVMGSYGIGVERIMACFIEQNFDESGIIWSGPLSPFDAHVISINPQKSDDARVHSDRIYDDLKNEGFDVLYDDREETPGVKFNDADLIGIPLQIIVGDRNLKNKQVELKIRNSGDRKLVDCDNIIGEVKALKQPGQV